MSISMYLDEYMARRGIVPDDTVVNDDPCAEFDGSVKGAGGAARREAADKLEAAEDVVRDLLG